MLDTGFLNQNLIRSFPFVYNDKIVVPDWLTVDFRAVVLEGEWDPRIHRVFLAWVSRYGDRLRFGFRTNAPGLSEQELVFERDLTDPTFHTTFAQAVPLLESFEERCGCSEELLCNPDLGQPGELDCGPELLCNPDFNIQCGEDLLCETTTTAAP